jgi:c-di-GMP-binding flagellar brake protein YcgR
MNYPWEDKRQSPRIKLQEPLRYQVRGSPVPNNVLSDNMSLGGMGFADDHFLAPDTKLELQIKILSRVLNLFGKVAWSQPLPHSDKYHCGVEFMELVPEQKEYLSDFINIRRVIQ